MLNEQLAIAHALIAAYTTGILTALPSRIEDLPPDINKPLARRVLELLRHSGSVSCSLGVWDCVHKIGSHDELRDAFVLYDSIEEQLLGHGLAAYRAEYVGERYGEIVETFEPRFRAAADELAHELVWLLNPVEHVLDIGAGSGVWGFSAASAFDAELTVVDMPPVIDVLMRRAEAWGLIQRIRAVHAGNVFEATLPTAELVLVANVFRVLPHDLARELMTIAAAAVEDGGHLVVVDVFDDNVGRTQMIKKAAYRLHLALRMETSGPYDELVRWADEEGLSLKRSVELGTAPLSESAKVFWRCPE